MNSERYGWRAAYWTFGTSGTHAPPRGSSWLAAFASTVRADPGRSAFGRATHSARGYDPQTALRLIIWSACALCASVRQPSLDTCSLACLAEARPEGERRLERETGIEPATNSLEGCDSTTELLPPSEC